MSNYMEDAVENLIEGAKSKKKADKWLNIANKTRFIKPISRFASNEAVLLSRLVEVHFAVANGCLQMHQEQMEK